MAASRRALLARLGAALRAATEDATLRLRMMEQGVGIVNGDAASVRGLLARETTLWDELIRSANIRPE